MNKDSTIYVTGHKGLVGSAIVRELAQAGYKNVWTSTHGETDLSDWKSTRWFFGECMPDYVFHCAAKVGGIQANIEKPVEFLLDNLNIQNNVMCAAHAHNVKKVLMIGSAAMYPRDVPRALAPSDLFGGPLDATKEGYAVAKLAGVSLARAFRKEYNRDFITVIPNNLYGIGDHYDPNTSHVIPAMIQRFHERRDSRNTVTCWGTGLARREFLFADDLARACLFLMDTYSSAEPINVGTGQDISMRELAALVAERVGFKGATLWDTDRPDGTMQRLLDVSKIFELGWQPTVTLLDGLNRAYKDFLTRL